MSPRQMRGATKQLTTANVKSGTNNHSSFVVIDSLLTPDLVAHVRTSATWIPKGPTPSTSLIGFYIWVTVGRRLVPDTRGQRRYGVGADASLDIDEPGGPESESIDRASRGGPPGSGQSALANGRGVETPRDRWIQA